jgi:hypothetical protein
LGTDKVLGLKWDVYGAINAVRLKVENQTNGCGSADYKCLTRDLVGTGTTTLNVKDFIQACYKIQLEITRNDGGVVRHNDLRLCVGSPAQPTNTPAPNPTATNPPAPTEVPLPPTPTPQP